MDLEKLNRTQIILLTLLVSFMTSIATGIVTVSLLEQAPPGVTQTINHVVERTIEKITPTQGAAVATKETTVVVKEDDLVTKSIQTDSTSLVQLFVKTPSADGTLASTFIGWGIVLTDKGIIATDNNLVSSGGLYAVMTSDGKSFDVSIASQNGDSGVALLQATAKDTVTFTPATLGDTSKLALGQSVIIFGGSGATAIALGNISVINSVNQKSDGTSTPEQVVSTIDVSTGPVANVRGDALADIFGDIIGMSVGNENTRFIGANIIQDELDALTAAAAKKTP